MHLNFLQKCNPTAASLGSVAFITERTNIFQQGIVYLLFFFSFIFNREGMLERYAQLQYFVVEENWRKM